MLILCREVDGYGGRPPAYYIVTKDVTDSDLDFLSLRSRLNPGLQYFATRLDETMSEREVLALFKTKDEYKEPLFTKI